MIVQDGIAGRRQLLVRGMASTAIDEALAQRRLHHVHRDFGVYALMPPELLTEEACLRAALYATGGRAVLAGATAAFRWQLTPARPLEIELATSRLELVGPPGVIVRRTLMRPGDVTRHDRLRTMTPARTLLDLACRYDPQPLLRAVRQAEFHHRLHPDDMLAILRRGHPGSRALRRAIARHVPGYGELKSRLERKFRALLIAHGVELPRRNARVGIYTVDCLWPDLRVIVELDGRQHLRPGQAVIDAERDLFLRSRGYVVRRYTWAQVTGPRQHEVVADLARAFEEARVLAAHRSLAA